MQEQYEKTFTKLRETILKDDEHKKVLLDRIETLMNKIYDMENTDLALELKQEKEVSAKRLVQIQGLLVDVSILKREADDCRECLTGYLKGV